MLMEILEKQEDLNLEQYVTDIKNSVTLDSIPNYTARHYNCL